MVGEFSVCALFKLMFKNVCFVVVVLVVAVTMAVVVIVVLVVVVVLQSLINVFKRAKL